MKSALLMLMVSAAVLPLVGAAAEPEVVYVTDELRLGLYRTEETSGRTIKTLISGTRLTVLERALMSNRVRTDDGDEGWVKTAYIVEAEPARSRLARIEAAAAVTTTQLADTEAALADRKAEVVRLKEELAAAEQGITDLPALREENATLRDTLNAGGTRVPLAWFIAATLIGFLIGGLVGYWLLDRRVRSRFGGVRVY